LTGSEIVSLAVLEAFPGKEDELLATLRELYAMMNAKGYSRDLLLREPTAGSRLFHLRYWKSDATRAEAQADPDVHRYWIRLPELCTVTVYEKLDKVFES
jgi:hypothetical protein